MGEQSVFPKENNVEDGNNEEMETESDNEIDTDDLSPEGKSGVQLITMLMPNFRIRKTGQHHGRVKHRSGCTGTEKR